MYKDKLTKEIKRCEELLKLYEEIPTGFFGASVIRQALKVAHEALDDNDDQGIRLSLEELQEIEG